jgi:lipoprotein-releasing system permease protein
MRLEWAIAWRYLRSRRSSALVSFTSMIAMGGVIVSVSALIVILGVMNGLQIDLREKILLGSPDVRVQSYGESLSIVGWEPVLETIRGLPGVVAASPFVLTQALATARSDYVEGVYVQGIPIGADAQAVTDIRDRAIDGDFRFGAAADGARGAVVGRLLAQRLNLFPGDTIRLISPAAMRGGGLLAGFLRGVEAFPVTGVFETGMYEYDNGWVYLELETAKVFAGMGSAVSGIEVKTTDRWAAPEVAATIDSVLGFPYRAVDWQAQNSSLFSALKLEKLAMTVILSLIVLVAAFNIVGTLSMVVRDKTREIGILRAMGLPARSVHRVFLWQGTVIGLVGTGVGTIIGVVAGVALERYRLIALDPEIYFIDHLPVILQSGDTILIVVGSILVATLATLYPARQAGRLFPVDAIRHE